MTKILYIIAGLLFFSGFILEAAGEPFPPAKYAPLRPSKLTSIPILSGQSCGLFPNIWHNSKGIACDALVASKAQCYDAVCPLTSIESAEYTENDIDRSVGTALHATDGNGKTAYGIIYSVDINDGKVTFHLVVPDQPQLDIRNIKKIDFQLNPYPGNTDDYDIKQLYFNDIPESGLFPASLHVAFPDPQDRFISLLNNAVDFSYDGKSRLPLAGVNVTCMDFARAQIIRDEYKCIKLHLSLTDAYENAPGGLIDRLVEHNVYSTPIFEQDKAYTGAIHYIPIAVEKDSASSYSNDYYLYALLVNKSFELMPSPYPKIEPIPDSYNIRLEPDYVSYAKPGRLEDLIPNFKTTLFPLSVGGSDSPTYDAQELNFNSSIFVAKQDWISHNGFMASAFNVVGYPYNEVIRVHNSELGNYGIKGNTPLVDGRMFLVSEQKNKATQAKAIIYDIAYESENGTPGTVDMYTKANIDISTLNDPNFTLTRTDLPQTDLFYYNPLGAFLPYEHKLDDEYSPLDPSMSQALEEYLSITSHKWPSVKTAMLNKVPNNCPTQATDPTTMLDGCSTALIPADKAQALLSANLLNSMPYDMTVKNPDGSPRINPGPYEAVEISFNGSGKYDYTCNIFIFYDLELKNGGVLVYFDKYHNCDFVHLDTTLLNQAIESQQKQGLLPPPEKAPFMYSVTPSLKAAYVPAAADDKGQLKNPQKKAANFSLLTVRR